MIKHIKVTMADGTEHDVEVGEGSTTVIMSASYDTDDLSRLNATMYTEGKLDMLATLLNSVLQKVLTGAPDEIKAGLLLQVTSGILSDGFDPDAIFDPAAFQAPFNN